MLRGPLALVPAMMAAVLALVAGGCGDDSAPKDDNGQPEIRRAVSPPSTGTISDIYERVSPAVVFIQARVAREQASPYGEPRPSEGVATGTGFLISKDGEIVTNAHVVAGAREIAIRSGEAPLVDAELVGSDLGTDLALLKIDPSALKATPLAFAEAKALRVGTPVLAIGNPLGLEDTITSGIVSGKQRHITAPNGLTIDDVIQTDAAVNQGNSGGPLLNLDGRVLGVNSQIATSGQGDTGFIGIAFAVPSETVQRVVPQLRERGYVRRPYLGVAAATVTPQMASALRLGSEHGAMLTAVHADGPADRAGLRAAEGSDGVLASAGDIVVEVAGEPVRTSEDLRRLIARQQPDSRVRLTIVRGERRAALTVRLGDRAE